MWVCAVCFCQNQERDVECTECKNDRDCKKVEEVSIKSNEAQAAEKGADSSSTGTLLKVLCDFISESDYDTDNLNVKKGDVVKLVDSREGWYWVEHDDTEGWIQANLVQPAEMNTIKRTLLKVLCDFISESDYDTDNLNVKKGDVVKLVDSREGWYWVEHDDTEGWIQANLVQPVEMNTVKRKTYKVKQAFKSKSDYDTDNLNVKKGDVVEHIHVTSDGNWIWVGHGNSEGWIPDYIVEKTDQESIAGDTPPPLPERNYVTAKNTIGTHVKQLDTSSDYKCEDDIYYKTQEINKDKTSSHDKQLNTSSEYDQDPYQALAFYNKSGEQSDYDYAYTELNTKTNEDYDNVSKDISEEPIYEDIEENDGEITIPLNEQKVDSVDYAEQTISHDKEQNLFMNELRNLKSLFHNQLGEITHEFSNCQKEVIIAVNQIKRDFEDEISSIKGRISQIEDDVHENKKNISTIYKMMEQNKDLVNHNNHMSDMVNTENISKGVGQAVPDEANQTNQNNRKQQQNTDNIYSFLIKIK
ncbi:unnamed protein product [Mytilus edulis]|uniref:SH3 domain-containing protein n=1 Tax=Mytilus edulis TaxID=6550 RepID=A0A8S3RQC7_MYTED|nr:unnamed protein product [Mytilus edulis]